MLPKTTYKYINNVQSSHIIQYSLLALSYNSIYHQHRHFSILQKSPPNNEQDTITPSETAQNNVASTSNPNPNANTTGNEQHIEVHAFRSLITIAPYVLYKKFPKFSDLNISYIYSQRSRQDRFK